MFPLLCLSLALGASHHVCSVPGGVLVAITWRVLSFSPRLPATLCSCRECAIVRGPWDGAIMPDRLPSSEKYLHQVTSSLQSSGCSSGCSSVLLHFGTQFDATNFLSRNGGFLRLWENFPSDPSQSYELVLMCFDSERTVLRSIQTSEEFLFPDV